MSSMSQKILNSLYVIPTRKGKHTKQLVSLCHVLYFGVRMDEDTGSRYYPDKEGKFSHDVTMDTLKSYVCDKTTRPIINCTTCIYGKWDSIDTLAELAELYERLRLSKEKP